MEIENYRERYEAEVAAIEFDIVANIAIIMSEHGLVKFKKKNTVKWNGKTITGILYQEGKMFICIKDKLMEVDEDNDDFAIFCADPYNFINLYESLVNELELNKPTAKIINMFNGEIMNN